MDGSAGDRMAEFGKGAPNLGMREGPKAAYTRSREQ